MSGWIQSIIINLTRRILLLTHNQGEAISNAEVGLDRTNIIPFLFTTLVKTSTTTQPGLKLERVTGPDEGGLRHSSPFTVWKFGYCKKRKPEAFPHWLNHKKTTSSLHVLTLRANVADLGKMRCLFMFFIVFLQTNKRMRASLRGRRKCWVGGRMLEILTSLRHVPAVVPSLTQIKQMLSAYGHTAEPARCHWRPITLSPRCDDAIQVQGHHSPSEQWLHRGWLGRHASHLSVRVCDFTFSTQFLWPGTEPWTYSTLYLVLTLQI